MKMTQQIKFIYKMTLPNQILIDRLLENGKDMEERDR